MEHGESEGAVICIREAVRHRLPELEQLREEPLFESLRRRADFQEAFRATPIVDWAALAAAERAKRKQQPMPKVDDAEAAALVALVDDLTGDAELVAQVRDRTQNPPRTAQEIGFYPSPEDNAFERCFRFAVSRMDAGGWLMSCEDKYSYEILEPFGYHGELPETAAEFLSLAQEIEERFREAGTPLCTLWTGGGDHLYFLTVDPEVHERWVNRALGHTHSGEPLGLCRPRWDRLLGFFAYALRWPESELTLSEWEPPKWR